MASSLKHESSIHFAQALTKAIARLVASTAADVKDKNQVIELQQLIFELQSHLSDAIVERIELLHVQETMKRQSSEAACVPAGPARKRT